MTSDINRERIVVILLFAIAFTMMGWLAPVLYATNIPQEQVIEVHDFTAQDTTTDSTEHYVCFDRTAHHAASATTFTELYMLTEDGQRVEIQSSSTDRYFQQGRDQVLTSLDLPDELAEGEYRYVLVAQVDMADGRVERTFAFKSEPFVVNDEAYPVESGREAIDNCSA